MQPANELSSIKAFPNPYFQANLTSCLSATRKLWQKSRWVLVNAVTGKVKIEGLVQCVLLAGRCPRMSLAFDRAEMEILATLSVQRF
jgi:hypothetical protein